MITVQGAYNSAVCYTDMLEKAAAGQIKAVCDQSAFADCKIRIMPDVHAGMGCTIGTTMTITDKVVPGMVGVDIGCGVETVCIAEKELNLAALDALICREIPCGREIRDTEHQFNKEIDLTELRCANQVNLVRARRSIGTLGGGNHFIEADRGKDGALYVVVHSGSRHIGNEVAKYYQEEGFRALCGNARFQLDEAIARMKAEGNTKEIHKTIKKLKSQRAMLTPMPKDLSYVEGRLMSRKDAFDRLSMEEYKEQMSDIFSTCVVADTLDESPMAYKPMDEIVAQITPTAEIVDRIKPIYNFKATE
ncbi:tRNA-splicing ligase RtcB [anaerobic digester metagenome]